jgi:multidrug resistance efflux pump
MRKFLVVLAASAALPLLILGQNARTRTFASSAAVPNVATPAQTATIDSCSVTPLAKDGEALVPAQEAGVIKKFYVGELAEVEEGTPMVQIDDAMAQKQFNNAEAEWHAADQKAKTDIDIQVAKAAAETSKFEYQKNYEAVYGTPAKGNVPAKPGVLGSVPETELNRLKFQWTRAELAIRQGEKDQIVNSFTADAKKAEMESAQEAINRRVVRAPFPGVVQKITPHIGEWVKPGDPVVRLIRMDYLKVEGYLKVAEINPGDVMNQKVTVKVVLAGGREVPFQGQIVYVDPEVKSLREFMVRAVVTNERDEQTKEWLLRPGLPAKMEIQLRQWKQLASN